jgi:hypothetical protein
MQKYQNYFRWFVAGSRSAISMDDNRPGRQPIRQSDHLSSLIREALAERIAHAQPSPFGRQVLLARAREAQVKKAKRRFLLYPFFRSAYDRRHAPSLFSTFSAVEANDGHRDPYLVVAVNNIMNPMVGMLR